MQKGFAPIIALVGIVVVAVLASGGYYFLKLKTFEQKVCTMDAKVCPDGSSVGRTGPNCEFAPCPKSSPDSDETANWKTYRNELFKYSFDYPAYLKIEDDIYEFAVADGPKWSGAISVHLDGRRDFGGAFKVLARQKDLRTTEEIASNIWQINKEDKNPNIPQKIVGSLESATFKGKPSYKFSVTSSVKIQSLFGVLTGFLIDRENTVLFVDGEVFVYGIIFPSSEPLANQILSTFKFLSTAADRDQNNYCTYKSLREPYTAVKDCGSFKVLVAPCCDFPDLILDEKGNKIMECGGIAGYSKECEDRFLPQTSCLETRCKN